MPAAHALVTHDRGIARIHFAHGSHVFRMVGHDEEIQRARKPGRLTRGGSDLFTASEPISLLRPEPGAKSDGIERLRGVQVRIAEEGAGGKVAFGVGRVGT